MIVQLNDESIEIEEEPEPVDEGLPKEAEPPFDDASPPPEHDLGLRLPISSSDVNGQDRERRAQGREERDTNR